MQEINEHVNWISVINFMQKEYTHTMMREKEWMLEKQTLLDRIDRLEGEVNGGKIMTDDLLNRIKLLEIALMEARTSNKINQPNKQEPVSDAAVESLLEKYHLEQKVKMKSHEEFLNRMMTDLKIDKSEYKLPQKQKNGGLMSFTSTTVKDETIAHLKESGKIVAHLDGIRRLYGSHHEDFVVSVGEDCLVKVWSYDAVLRNKHEHLQPVLTFRQHTGPLFALAGGRHPYHPENSVFFTGGNQGIIKYWEVKDRAYKTSTIPVGNLNSQAEENAIVWDLAMRNFGLLSSSSDGFVRLYRIKSELGAEDNWQKQRFRDKDFNSTCVCWVSAETFLSGCSNAPRAYLWDTSGKICQKYLYDIEKSKDAQQFQINQMVYNPTLKCIVSGCEDGNIRIFSHGVTKITRKIEGGSAVSSVATRKEWQIVGGMHDGSMGVWDIRNYKKILAVPHAHHTKYDEGVFDVHCDGDSILTAGADGIIKVYS